MDELEIAFILCFLIFFTSGCVPKTQAVGPVSLLTFNTDRMNKQDDQIICRDYPYTDINEVSRKTLDAIIEADLLETGREIGFGSVNSYCASLEDRQYRDDNGRCHDYLTGRFERCR